MKLYTEEQVKSLLIRHLNYFSLISVEEQNIVKSMENCVKEVIEELTPLEIPSDEKIYIETLKMCYKDEPNKIKEDITQEEMITIFGMMHSVNQKEFISFIEGVKWMRDKILNQTK